MENLIATAPGSLTDEAQRNVAIAIAQQVADYFTKEPGDPKYRELSIGKRRNPEPHQAPSATCGKDGPVSGTDGQGGAEGGGGHLRRRHPGLQPGTDDHHAFLKGLLHPILKENVNFINAPLIARDRGIRVIRSRSSGGGDYKSMLSVTMKTTQDGEYTARTIFGQKDYHVVRINKFTLDVIPEGNMIVLYSYDKPGVIGNIGTTLGASNVNIARLHLSRQQVDGQALVVLTTDGTVPEEVIQRLRDLPNVISVNQLELAVLKASKRSFGGVAGGNPRCRHPRHCDVPISTSHSSGFGRLASGSL